MSDTPPAVPGTLAWFDLTVPNADTVRDFYASVLGWATTEVDMGGYADYAMGPDEGGPITGVCHARGANASQPPQWILYINVADLHESLRRCEEAGGARVTEIRGGGKGPRFCVIRDPAGAVLGLMEPASEPPSAEG